MKPSNTINDYSETEINDINVVLKCWFETLTETDELLTKEIEKPTPQTPENNVIYLDFRPLVEYNRLKDHEMPIHEIIQKYDDWNDLLWKQVKLNVGNIGNKKVKEYLVKLRLVVASFGNLLVAPTDPNAS
jgi:hypothetical protein